ncbi:MAG: hypothetical protein J6C39_00890 [Clostridia bacterium]|nr:hypothetical protein [Clostridia bacterium]
MIAVKVEKVRKRRGPLSGLVTGAVEHILLSGDKVKLERYTAYRLLSDILKKDFSCDPESLALEFEEGGRPYLHKDGVRSAIDFSISHSGELVLVAVSDSVRVGADLQKEVSAALGERLDKRFVLSASIVPHREKISLFTEDSPAAAAKILKKTAQNPEGLPTEGSGEMLLSGACDGGIASYGVAACSAAASLAVATPSSATCRELDKTELWATAEALLKLDGRGFSAYSLLGEILSEKSVGVACASFAFGDRNYAAALCVMHRAEGYVDKSVLDV